MSFISVKGLTKEYQMGEVVIKALHDVSFDIEEGELVVILGPSGAGKTTILNILGGMDQPTRGKVVVDGNVISDYSLKQLTNYRRYDIGSALSIGFLQIWLANETFSRAVKFPTKL